MSRKNVWFFFFFFGWIATEATLSQRRKWNYRVVRNVNLKTKKIIHYCVTRFNSFQSVIQSHWSKLNRLKRTLARYFPLCQFWWNVLYALGSCANLCFKAVFFYRAHNVSFSFFGLFVWNFRRKNELVSFQHHNSNDKCNLIVRHSVKQPISDRYLSTLQRTIGI